MVYGDAGSAYAGKLRVNICELRPAVTCNGMWPHEKLRLLRSPAKTYPDRYTSECPSLTATCRATAHTPLLHASSQRMI